MSRRRHDPRHLAASASLPLGTPDRPDDEEEDEEDRDTLYANCDRRPIARSTTQSGPPEPWRQRAMSDSVKTGSGSRKPMPPPKPVGFSTGRAVDAAVVPGGGRRPVEKQSPEEEEEEDENLYEDALTVRTERLVAKNDRGKHPVAQDGLYGVACPVAGHRLPSAEKGNADPEPLYEEASAVCVSRIPGRKPPFTPGNSKSIEEENLYEDAAAVSLPNLQGLYEDAVAVSQYKLPLAEANGTHSKSRTLPTEPIYSEATPVLSKRLPRDENLANHKSSPGNCEADSSDDEEPLYFNLVLLQKSMENQKLWNSRADPHIGRAKVEQNARRISTIKVLPVLPSKKFGHHMRSVSEDPTSREAAHRSLSQQQQSFDDEWSDDLIGLQTCDEAEMKKMRKWIISDILKSEKSYCELLERLNYLMSTLKDRVGASHEIISLKDIETIFFGIQELCSIHSDFVKNLQPVVDKSSKDFQIGKFLKEMIEKEYRVAEEYLKKHHESISTLKRCFAENQQFADLTKTMKYRQMETNFEELLRKPIERFQCNALILHDLKNCTPTGHKDFELIQGTLKTAKNFLDICSGSSNDSLEGARYLVKNGIVVEKPDKTRKLRHIFLFNDILVCCKQKISTARAQRLTYEVRWYIPLCDLKLEDKFSAQEEKQADIRHQEEISIHKKELVKLQKELKEEMQKMKTADGQILTHKQNKPLESIRKKLAEQEAKLLVASPHLQLKLTNQAIPKTFVLLMASDYERTNWKSTISGLLGKANQTPARLSLTDVINLINSQRIPKLLGSALDNNGNISLEEERLNGSLSVTIHQLQGLREEANAFCSVEIDSFGHFFMKAKTNRLKGRELVWNEDFDIDLEGAQSMHILCYKIGQHTDSLLGMGSLILQKEWITEDFKNKAISLGNDLLLTVTLKYTPPEHLKRSASTVKSDLFGMRLERIAKREGRSVPLIVTACIEEIEKRGLKDVGIYRISGLSAETQRIKKVFNKNSSSGMSDLVNTDTNVVTGLLKLFFRELPEALFTDSGYPEFVKGIGLSDPDTKERFLVSQLFGLPSCNYATIIYLLSHLVKVSQHEESNKMSLMNLATVFGPTLLRPAEKDQKATDTESLFSKGAGEVVLQSTILLYFLNLKAKNYDFPPPKSGK